MIPINQILASKILGDSAKLALHLVGYEQDVCRAIKFVFGNKLICADAQTAKEVTFDQKVCMKSKVEGLLKDHQYKLE
ncbi:hypothetical protein PPACK8108_LOCUS433, partial [Phakopsora pachyrhizi]